jgi:CBS domain containing-hemolysin-like protein
MMAFLYVLGVPALCVGLVIFSYLDRIYRELGRVTKGRVREHLETFEAEIEPHFGLERSRATTGFRLLANLWLVIVTAETARGVIVLVPSAWDALAQALVYVVVEVFLLSQFIPDFLLARTKGRWLVPLALVIRAFLWLVWPFRVILELAFSLNRISDDQHVDGTAAQQEGIGALVDAAEHEGILDPGEAHMIEQVVEFSDKRVLEFMTPRPEVVAISAGSTVSQLRALLVETKFSRIPVYEKSLDDITGVAFARDLLQIPESEAATRTVRELARSAFFVPETKHGSDLLKEMQRRNQQMAIVVDEFGSVGGIVTIEDLVEEIIGEIGEDDRVPSPDAVREPDGSLILRGSVSVKKIQELFGVEWDVSGEESATTIGGLLNHVAGHVPAAGEHVDYGGLRFEILEANQRKVLRLRGRRIPADAAANGAAM